MNDSGIYTLSDGVTDLLDREHSRIMFALVDLHPEASRDFTWDDIGMATLMQSIYQDEIKYCPQNKNWYIWEKRWKVQNDDGIVSDKLQTLLNLLKIYADEVTTDENEETMSKYKKWLSSIRKYSAMRGILEVFKTMVRLPLYEMDNHPYVINTQNGAYDLRTGERIEDIKPLGITKCANTYPAHFLTKKCTRWYQFIDEITSGDKEKAAFLQRALGYSLLGVNREECAFLIYGPKTRNGKGTLFSAIKEALSEDYADTASSDLICEDKRGRIHDFNAPQPALAKIKSTRIVEMSESEQGIMIASAALKSLTGRDKLVTRGLYENSFTFLPQFTLWLSTNYLPAVTDDTIFRSNRIWVIEFNENFADNPDTNLKELFTAPENQPTVLKWLMDGASDYIKNGLQIPACVRQATQNYRDRFDRINNFIKDCCEVGEDKKVLRGTLYTIYTRWCKRSENKYCPLGSVKFYAEMEIRGFHCTKNHGDYFVKGIDAVSGVESSIPL